MCDRGTLCGECEQRGSIVECMRGGDRVALLWCVCGGWMCDRGALLWSV